MIDDVSQICCVIYTRFSPRPNGNECDSCQKQEERCIAYADKRHYYIAGAWRDENVSGGSIIRPGLQKAITLLTPGFVLIVDRLDRLSRDIAVGLAIREQIKAMGCTVEYVDGTPSGDSPEDTLFQNIMDSFSTFERDRIRFNTKRAMGKKRAACERVGQIPVGWMLDPNDPKRKQLIKNEDEWHAIKLICCMAVDGWKINEIAANLNKDPKDGNRFWQEKTIRRIIKKHRFWACPKTGDPVKEPTHPI